MNAPQGTQTEPNEEGGMLVAALAGVGILVAVGLLIFSGGDKEAASEGKGDDSAAAAKAQAGGSSKSAFAARDADAATRAPRDGTENKAPTARMNPNVKGMMVNEGIAADATTRKPPTFDNPDDERDWWERQLRDAQRLQGMRQRGVEKLPEIEKSIEEAADPEQARAQFEQRRERLLKALEQSEARVAEIEAKLAELR